MGRGGLWRGEAGGDEKVESRWGWVRVAGGRTSSRGRRGLVVMGGPRAVSSGTGPRGVLQPRGRPGVHLSRPSRCRPPSNARDPRPPHAHTQTFPSAAVGISVIPSSPPHVSDALSKQSPRTASQGRRSRSHAATR